ncbi:hypothetical protein QWY75_11410 [Pontixanthobacter aestiaquae]|uniref:Uncharacterized protein n=1 Tax=Pontixanthobacter aestiaquae TaxID=1509367 RepID=A0A844Z8H2_9SPHN|nr:hypothetical protein [Pontixanthobacter aestiaquae]MDN3646809.1 hypothetical protein [Pontixanthobacter aestiaquae]MXO82209.1 hypothetical protein [Pontixanthobacter aestiaquae]
MFSRDLVIEHHGQKIRATNEMNLPLADFNSFGLSSNAKLYIDGDLRDSSSANLGDGSRPLLSGSVQHGDQRSVIEVYYQSTLSAVKIKVCADGCRIAGDNF